MAHNGYIQLYRNRECAVFQYAADKETYEVLVQTVAPAMPSAIAVDRANGEALIWAESTSTDGGNEVTLWTTPYATKATEAVARKVARLPRVGNMVANRGVVLTRANDTTALVTRLSDGMSWTITAEPGESFAQPLWVDDDEAWLLTAESGLPNPKLYASGVVRIRRDKPTPTRVLPITSDTSSWVHAVHAVR